MSKHSMSMAVMAALAGSAALSASIPQERVYRSRSDFLGPLDDGFWPTDMNRSISVGRQYGKPKVADPEVKKSRKAQKKARAITRQKRRK